MEKSGRLRQAMRAMHYSVQRHAKTLQIEYQMKKNKQSTLVYTSQVNLLTQHIVWESRSITPHEPMLSQPRFTGGAGCWSPAQKAGSRAPADPGPGPVTLQGHHREGWGVLPLVWKTCAGPGEQNSHTPRDSPEPPLNPCIPEQKWAEPVNNGQICHLHCALF